MSRKIHVLMLNQMYGGYMKSEMLVLTDCTVFSFLAGVETFYCTYLLCWSVVG